MINDNFEKVLNCQEGYVYTGNFKAVGSNDLVIDLSMPVFYKGSLKAVIGLELLGEELTEFLGQKEGNNISYRILSDTKEVIYCASKRGIHEGLTKQVIINKDFNHHIYLQHVSLK